MTQLTHKTIKAATTTKDKGQFTALAATYSIDRMDEQIVPGAFSKTIDAWRNSEKNVPLHWDHAGEAENVIGYVDPSKMEETDKGLYVEGQLDLEDSDVAKEAWRSMKNGAVSLSFGYLATQTEKSGKITLLKEIDLFEVSIVPAPANADTRVLSLKAVDQFNGVVQQINNFAAEPEKKKLEGQNALLKQSIEALLR